MIKIVPGRAGMGPACALGRGFKSDQITRDTPFSGDLTCGEPLIYYRGQ